LISLRPVTLPLVAPLSFTPVPFAHPFSTWSIHCSPVSTTRSLSRLFHSVPLSDSIRQNLSHCPPPPLLHSRLRHKRPDLHKPWPVVGSMSIHTSATPTAASLCSDVFGIQRSVRRSAL
jgi:hypothetical protein